MAGVIQLKKGEHPPAHTHHALVISSSKPPEWGVPAIDQGLARLFFAKVCEKDIAIMVRRAMVWADARGIARVYVRRDD